jgi:Carboxypeptidase regulatory-like domain/TonB-dependent Receptor Plug Domain
MRQFALRNLSVAPATKTEMPVGLFRCAALGFAALLVIALMIMPIGAGAQLAGKGAITGTVQDKTGAVIGNATVTATNNATGISTVTKSTGAGDYNFSDLDPGVYSVTTFATGFEKLTQQNIQVNALETQTYNPALQVGAADVQITVSAAPPQLETSNATLGATMDQETYSALPLEMGGYNSADQRRATDFVYLMPGVQGNETNGNATTNTGVVNGSGSRGAASDVYVDGVPFVRAGGNGDPRYVWTAISVDAVDQFQVQTSGYSAIYEGQGVSNYSIKQGGSQFHGSVYEFLRNTAFDTWGFFGSVPNAVTGKPVKPIEHSNEYGIVLSGPLVPFGSWKQKVFFFGNYNGFRYSSATPTLMTFPTVAQQNGDFSAFLALSSPVKIYDPLSQTACTANSTNGPCRYQYGYGPGSGPGLAGNPTLLGSGSPVNVIPASEFSTVAKNMQAFLASTGINKAVTTALQNNYVAPDSTGLVNWSMTHRIDYTVDSRDTLSFIASIGRQASSVPVGQTTAGRNVGPIPYNFGQAYAPKTAVGIIEETHVFSPHLLNQVKWGYARYNGPTFNADEGATYAATAMGLTGLPKGQASDAFPFVTFAGTDAPTNWAGEPASVTIAENYTALDNLQWTVGKHSFTFGGQVAWMLYNVINDTSGTSPITLATAVTETSGINPTCATACAPGTTAKYVATSGTGLSYASFLTGEIDKGSFTDYLQQEFGARFRAISPYAQDTWKVNSKLTLDLGLRYDFFPTVTEVHNAESYYSPTLANPITGVNGALQFTGHGAGTCNCATPVNNYFKNFGPRVGLAFQLDPSTVIRASYGVMFTHGDAIGGLASSIGTLGFSAAPSFSANGQLLSTMPLTGANGAIPGYTGALGVASGPQFGTGYTTTSGFTGTPSSIGYVDPYYGGRAPEYLNWNFGIQRQLTPTMALTVTYVGSEGHFEQLDSFHARGFWADDLDPKYLYLGSTLGGLGTGACAANNLTCPTGFTASQPLSTALKPFPFQTVSDSFGYVGNSNYNALQAVLGMRTWHGLTLNSNFTWSRAIDDGGTFRTGYAIPAGTLANHPSQSLPADRIDRTVSTSNQPLHFVLTSVWAWPFGKSVLSGNEAERAILGGFTFSGVYQAFRGSPLALTEATTQTNPAESTFEPILNPAYFGQNARQNGKWGKGITAANTGAISYIVPSTGTTAQTATGPFENPVTGVLSSYAYQFSDAARTAPYNLYGPGNYQLDLAMVRSFPLHFTESAHLDIRAEWYNITNHTWFAVASTAVGNSSFGDVTSNSIATRKAAQFSARVSF